jgi:hypothetical protein
MRHRQTLVRGHRCIPLALALGAQWSNLAIAQAVIPARDIELTALIELATEQLGLTLQYDRSLVARASVRLQVREELTHEELWKLTNWALQSNGLTTVRVPDTDAFAVVRVQEATARAPLTHADDAGPHPGFRRVLIPLHATTATDAIASVRPLLSRGVGDIEIIADGVSLVVADFTPNVDAIVAEVAGLDKAVSVPIVVIYRFGATDPTSTLDAARRLLSLDIQTGITTVIGQDGRTVFVRGPAKEVGRFTEMLSQIESEGLPYTRSYSPRGVGLERFASVLGSALKALGLDSNAEILLDDISGVVSLIGPPAAHAQAEDLAKRLAELPPSQLLATRTFTVRHRSPEKAVDLIKRLMASERFRARVRCIDWHKYGSPAPIGRWT